MADPKALERLLSSKKSYAGAADWNNFRSQSGPVDLAQADLAEADLKDHNFARCNLVAAKLFNADLTGADFTEAHLSYADLRRANLANAYCGRANLQVAKLQGANLVDCNLEGANLKNAHGGGAYLVGANLAGADLTEADLRGANLKYARLDGAIVKGAKVEDADLTGVKLTKEQIESLRGYSMAVIRGKQAPAANAKKRVPVEEDHEDLFREADCYKILGIAADATLEEIDRAYRQRIHEYHPDKVERLGEKLKVVAQREFHRIQHAYRSLTRHRAKLPATVADESLAAARIDHKDLKDYTVEDYLALLKSDPTNAAAHYNLGIQYFEKGLVELAIQSYQNALRLDPHNEDVIHNLQLAELAKTLGGN